TGTVEVDETFLGGKRSGMGHGYKGNKTIVMAAVERDGDVRLRMVPTRDRSEIRGFIEETVSDDATAVYTDEHPASKGGVKGRKAVHGRVKHSGFKPKWVHGKVHTNTVEGVFSLLDRSIIGAYHKVSTKHLPRYLDEVEWRYNNRKNPYLFRDT